MSKCLSKSIMPACFTAADGTRTTLVFHEICGKDGTPVAWGYTSIDDPETFVDTTGGTITAGACPIPSPDVEWEKLCDVQADGTSVSFYCQVITSFDGSGLPITPSAVANYELDKVTPYVITGTVTDCGDCPEIESIGLLTSWDTLKAAQLPTVSEGGEEGGGK